MSIFMEMYVSCNGYFIAALFLLLPKWCLNKVFYGNLYTHLAVTLHYPGSRHHTFYNEFISLLLVVVIVVVVVAVRFYVIDLAAETFKL